MSNQNQQTKRALIVVDVQNDFCPGGALAVTDGEKVIPPLNKLMQEFLERGELVIKTRDWHPAVTKHFKDYGGIWVTHCVQNTRGAEFHKDMMNDPRIIVVSKGTGNEDGYSGFDGTNLAEILREHDVEEVWVGGLATDYCVKNTVFDALKNNFKVKVIENAIRAVNLEPNDGAKAIDEMRVSGARVA